LPMASVVNRQCRPDNVNYFSCRPPKSLTYIQ
jgi:hypothetical protein